MALNDILLEIYFYLVDRMNDDEIKKMIENLDKLIVKDNPFIDVQGEYYTKYADLDIGTAISGNRNGLLLLGIEFLKSAYLPIENHGAVDCVVKSEVLNLFDKRQKLNRISFIRRSEKLSKICTLPNDATLEELDFLGKNKIGIFFTNVAAISPEFKS